MTELEKLIELGKLIEQKKEIEDRIKILKNQEVRNIDAKFFRQTYASGRTPDYKVAINVWTMRFKQNERVSAWRSIVEEDNKQTAIERIQVIIDDLTGLLEKLKENEE